MKISEKAINEKFRWIEESYPFKELVTQITDQTDKYINILTTAHKYVPEGGSILDFGSGTAVAASLLARDGFKVAGIDDLNDPMHQGQENLDAIKQFYKDSDVSLYISDGDLSIKNLVGSETKFDMIMCHDVLEHLHDSPKILVEDMLDMLTVEGVLFLSIPNASSLRKRIAVLRGRSNYAPFTQYYEWPGKWRGHVREYVINDLRTLADLNSLVVEELRGCDHMTQKLPRFTKFPYMVFTGLQSSLKDCVMLVAKR